LSSTHKVKIGSKKVPNNFIQKVFIRIKCSFVRCISHEDF